MGVVRVSEKSFMATVTAFAKLYGWKVFHVYNSQRSEPGFPDLVMVRLDRVVFAELKTDTGKVTTSQQEWLDLLKRTPTEVYLWRPRDWPQIERVLGAEP